MSYQFISSKPKLQTTWSPITPVSPNLSKRLTALSLQFPSTTTISNSPNFPPTTPTTNCNEDFKVTSTPKPQLSSMSKDAQIKGFSNQQGFPQMYISLKKNLEQLSLGVSAANQTLDEMWAQYLKDQPMVPVPGNRSLLQEPQHYMAHSPLTEAQIHEIWRKNYSLDRHHKFPEVQSTSYLWDETDIDPNQKGIGNFFPPSDDEEWEPAPSGINLSLPGVEKISSLATNQDFLSQASPNNI